MRPLIPGSSLTDFPLPVILQGPSLGLPVLYFPNVSVCFVWVRNSLPDICTTSHLSFNFSLGILLAACLGYGKKAMLEVCWGVCAFWEVFSWYMAKECQLLGILDLIVFLGIQRLSILLAAASIYSHQQPSRIFFPPDSLPYLLPVDLCHWPLWVFQFDFQLSFWLAFL